MYLKLVPHPKHKPFLSFLPMFSTEGYAQQLGKQLERDISIDTYQHGGDGQVSTALPVAHQDVP